MATFACILVAWILLSVLSALFIGALIAEGYRRG